MDDKHSSVVKNYLIPMGSVLVAALALLAKTPSSWVTVSVVLYISFVVIYMLFPFGREKVAKRLARRRIIKAIKQSWLSVNKLLEEVEPQLESRRSGTVFSVWREAASKEGIRGSIYADYSHFDTLNTWLVRIRDDVNSTKISEGIRVVRDFNAWLLQYTQLCDQARRDIETVIRSGKLEGKDLEEVKQEWNHSRDGHNRVITDWSDVCREINRISGVELFNSYFRTLKPL